MRLHRTASRAILAAWGLFAAFPALADIPPPLQAQPGAPPGYETSPPNQLIPVDAGEGSLEAGLTDNFFGYWETRQNATLDANERYQTALTVLESTPISEPMKDRIATALRERIRYNEDVVQRRQQHLAGLARTARSTPLTSEQYIQEMERLRGPFGANPAGTRISEQDLHFLHGRADQSPRLQTFMSLLDEGQLLASGQIRGRPGTTPDGGFSNLTRATGATCRSPCGWEALGLTIGDITAGIASQYGGSLSNVALAYIGPYSTSSRPRLLDAFSSWTERFTPDPNYSVRLNSGNGWHMLVRDQQAPGLVTTFDPRGLDQLPTEGAQVIGGLYRGTTAQDAVLLAVANGQNLALLGRAALGQAGLLPLHVFVQWNAGVRDLDLHATGPLGAGRFHVYYASPGSLGLEPNTLLHVDCICEGGSEVITLNDLNPGGVYRFSVFNFGNQSPTSTQLSNSAMTLTVISGGTVVDRTAVDGSRGSAVNGGRIVLQPIAPPRGVAGNTWEAVEIDPNTGAILGVNRIVNSSGSSGVR